MIDAIMHKSLRIRGQVETLRQGRQRLR